jgi:hypothetical protein
MSTVKYVPVFRVRTQENAVLRTFNFGDRIYPCLEIYKERDRLRPKARRNSKKQHVRKPEKTFEDFYIPFIDSIQAKRVFVDLPVHLTVKRNMKPESLDFLLGTVQDRVRRTAYMIKLKPLGNKVIPVISSYFPINSKPNSITAQETDLRLHFKDLAFRTFAEPDKFGRDIAQIIGVIRPSDYLIVDWGEQLLNENDDDQKEIIERLEELECTVVIHRSPVSKETTNSGLEHEEVIHEIINDLIEKYEDFSGNCFSDYAGIKKDDIVEGGRVSPGFIFYEPVDNEFYGFRGTVDVPATFETVLVPAVFRSPATAKMRAAELDYLGAENIGWSILENIANGDEPGKSASKFKRISMEHYLHCIKLRIEAGIYD